MSTPDEQARMEILLRLIQMVKPWGAVWADGGHAPSIRYELFGEPIQLTWAEAAELTGLTTP